MIEFYGKITGECRQYIMKREAIVACVAFTVAAVLVSIPIVILSVTYDPLIWIMMAVPGGAIVLSFIPFFLKDYGLSDAKLIFPMKISVDEDGEMLSENNRFHEYRHVSQVKKVVDMGEFYVLYFYWRHRTFRYVCQKNLLTKGTLEEFEALFKEKLVVRAKT